MDDKSLLFSELLLEVKENWSVYKGNRVENHTTREVSLPSLTTLPGRIGTSTLANSLQLTNSAGWIGISKPTRRNLQLWTIELGHRSTSTHHNLQLWPIVCGIDTSHMLPLLQTMVGRIETLTQAKELHHSTQLYPTCNQIAITAMITTNQLFFFSFFGLFKIKTNRKEPPPAGLQVMSFQSDEGGTWCKKRHHHLSKGQVRPSDTSRTKGRSRDTSRGRRGHPIGELSMRRTSRTGPHSISFGGRPNLFFSGRRAGRRPL